MRYFLWLMRSARRFRDLGYPGTALVVLLVVGHGVPNAPPASAGRGVIERPALPSSSVQSPLPQPGHEFYFTRGVYSDYSGRRFGAWRTDFPKADRQFLIGLKHLTNIDAYESENPVRLDDPQLRRYPFLYVLEVGYMALTEAEVNGLRAYLQAGGFLVVDDFWGTYEWQNFEAQLHRVLPEFSIVDIPPQHPLLTSFYDIRTILQVPNIRLGRAGGRTWERDGYDPALRGVFDDRGRLLVVINWNTDLGDAWEWAEDPWYPIRFSNFAYQLGVNMIVYGMSH